ncbi:MAG TPA: hypothetical protein QF694_01610 [Dehalococcoidia bacterium]|jgi:hypothetical protein|nr:hypothetical protein [Chloroflexota bacterium]MDP6056395.1 hypothetical protein [Dehalococcoidia bacterium]MDP7485703.1 hypothetical protein [Dehalococcoidia bacterium]HJP27492.1 hypothetical protein [Dehalococcoidia bacterium]|tara:strand:- start:5680 stop:6414 length:735 start_codon:yes stop_codon:yes gene_type:complete
MIVDSQESWRETSAMSKSASKNSPQLRTLFPDFWRIDSLVRAEVIELPDEVLDWSSDRWGWSGWSIRQQASHMASVPLRWLIGRWGEHLFGDSPPVSKERYALLNSEEHDRRLDDRKFWAIADILGALDEVISISRQVLIATTVERARSIVVQRAMHDQWELMRSVHPDGIHQHPETGEFSGMDLVATFRHIQNEFYTHLFNVQREKIALGCDPMVKLPDAGYHTAKGWDSDLPEFGSARTRIG